MVKGYQLDKLLELFDGPLEKCRSLDKTLPERYLSSSFLPLFEPVTPPICLLDYPIKLDERI